MSDEILSKTTQAPPKQLKSVAERLNVFQELESRERAFEHMDLSLQNH